MKVNLGVGRIIHNREIQRTKMIAQDIVDLNFGVEKPDLYRLGQVYQVGRSVELIDTAKMGKPNSPIVG